MRRVVRALPVQTRSVILAAVYLLVALKIVSAAPDIKLAQGDLSTFMDTPCYMYHQFSDDDIGGWNIITTQKGSGYSTLGGGRPGTPSQGRIYILFDGCKDGVWGAKAAVFNLSWLLDGEKTGNGEVPEWIENSR